MVEVARNSRTGRSLRAKGMATRAAILDTAHEVFKTKGYYSSSISEITRRCGVSKGTFYQYYKNKEQVFLELNDLIISRFIARADSCLSQELDFEGRFREVIRLLYDHMRDNFAFNRILGESELIDSVTIAYYESIARYYRNFLRREAQSGNVRLLDPNMLAYGLTGICYFNSLDWAAFDNDFSHEAVIEMIVDFTLNGLNGSAPWKKPSDWDFFYLPDPASLHSEKNKPKTKGEKTRNAIFRAAEKVFGQHGINGANISDITREAGVAQGTFYIHFQSKNDLIEGLVKYINHEMRKEVQRVAGNAKDRRDAERMGIYAFFEFIQRHRQIYRVVPECEMISREVADWYYKKTASGYMKGLEQGIKKGEIRDLPTHFLARSLMGFTHFLGLKWIIWNPSPRAKVPRNVFKDIIEFLLFGLKPNPLRP